MDGNIFWEFSLERHGNAPRRQHRFQWDRQNGFTFLHTESVSTIVKSLFDHGILQ